MTWWLAPHLETASWSQHLLAHGFQHDDHTPGLAADLTSITAATHPTLTIRHVDDGPALATWARTFLQG